jgi:hypothetical protein
MKFSITVLFILLVIDAFSSIEFYNYNEEPVSRSYIEFSSLNQKILRQSIKSKKYFGFNKELNDTTLLRTIDTIIVNHNNKTKNIFKNSYFEENNFNYSYKILGTTNENSKNLHFVVLSQPINKDILKGKLLLIYLLNFNEQYQLVSTAIIGEYYKASSKGMYYDEIRPIYYKASSVTDFFFNRIKIMEEQSISTSIYRPLIKRIFEPRKPFLQTIELLIKENGEIEEIT